MSGDVQTMQAMARPAPIVLVDRPFSTAHATLQKARRVLSARTGIITGIDHARTATPFGALHAYRAELERTTLHAVRALTSRRALMPDAWCREPFVQGRVGYSPSFDPTRAFVAAVGEALERYANAMLYDPMRLITASFREVADVAEDPRRSPLYDDEERLLDARFGPFDADAPMRWVWATRLGDGATRLVPAQSCWLFYNPIPGEPLLKQGTGTGWAAHGTLEECILKGLDEVMERDAYTIVWRNRLIMPRLDIATSGEPRLVRAADLLARAGARLHLIVTTTDTGYPTFLAVAEGRSSDVAPVTVTMGAGISPRSAAVRAAEECLGAFLLTTDMVRQGDTVPDPEAVRGLLDHFRYWADPSRRGRIAWLWSSPEEVRLQDLAEIQPRRDTPKGHVEAAVAALGAAGHDVLALDTTPPDLAEAGFRTAKVIVPEACQMEFGNGLVGKRSRRLYAAPVAMGRRPQPLDPSALNLEVHPHS